MSILDGKKVDLDLPVNAYDAEGNPTGGVSEDGSTEVSQTEEKKEEPEVDEQRVPYSRFDKVRREREQALEEADEARRAYRELQESRSQISRETPSNSSYEEDYTRRMKQLLGDNPVSQEIIELELRNRREIEERAEHRAVQAIERMREGETRALIQNENVIDTRLEFLSEALGRPLTEKEESALLGIVDEYTPTGTDGKYVGEILPFDKAWEVYELRQAKSTTSSKKSRSGALSASSARSQGEPSSVSDPSQKKFSSNDWSSYYERVNKI